MCDLAMLNEVKYVLSEDRPIPYDFAQAFCFDAAVLDLTVMIHGAQESCLRRNHLHQNTMNHFCAWPPTCSLHNSTNASATGRKILSHSLQRLSSHPQVIHLYSLAPCLAAALS